MFENPSLLKWLIDDYPKHSKAKPDMGKSCIRFKKPGNIPYILIGDLVKKVSVQEWTDTYGSIIKNNRQ